MKAVVKYAPGSGHIDVRDVTEPACGPGLVKVQVAFCGVCGTDLHVLHDTFRNYPPVILGHECAGTVTEVGAGVRGVSVGDPVTVLGATAVTCGQCAYCRSGYFIFCPERRGMGHGVDGAFARYLVVRPDQLYRLPDGMSLEAGALSEPFAAVVQAVTEITQVRLGETAVVSGPGPIGLLCAKLLVAEGIQTIVAGTAADRDRLSAATRFGATHVVNVEECALGEAVREATGGVGADVAFECSGHPDSVRGCLNSLRPMGRYTQVGICGREIQFPMDQVFYKQLTVRGSITYTAATWSRMMNIFAQGKVRLDDMVSTTLPIIDWQRAFDMVEDRSALKVLLYPVD
jgi:L-iditol 2-dehydrogenase